MWLQTNSSQKWVIFKNLHLVFKILVLIFVILIIENALWCNNNNRWNYRLLCYCLLLNLLWINKSFQNWLEMTPNGVYNGAEWICQSGNEQIWSFWTSKWTKLGGSNSPYFLPYAVFIRVALGTVIPFHLEYERIGNVL